MNASRNPLTAVPDSPNFPNTVSAGIDAVRDTLSQLQTVWADLQKRLGPASYSSPVSTGETSFSSPQPGTCHLQSELQQINSFADSIRADIADTITRLRL